MIYRRNPTLAIGTDRLHRAGNLVSEGDGKFMVCSHTSVQEAEVGVANATADYAHDHLMGSWRGEHKLRPLKRSAWGSHEPTKCGGVTHELVSVRVYR